MRTISSCTALALWLTLTLAGCDKTPDATAPAETAKAPEPAQTIEWFKGSVDQAFATAKATNKPLFLYWGAVWCPPCEEVKNTVFKTDQFIALTRLFVPVYIDGDSDQAQAIGERFGVKGYPTMIVFNPAGQEVTRIPGGIDISKYNSVLQLSLNRLRPTRELLQLALNDPDKLQPDDFTQLAYYSWEQDNDVLPADAPDTLFKDLSDIAQPHDKVAAARLYMQYLVNQSRKKHDDKHDITVDGARDRLTDILNSDQLVLACWESLAYFPEIADIVDGDDHQKLKLEQLWRDRLMSLRHDSSIVPAEQLAGWLPLLHFHFATTQEPLSKNVDEALEADIDAVNRSTDNPFARQAVVDQIAYVYQQAHKVDEARSVLLAELDKAAAPWYFMSDIASLAEDQHQNEEAIKWYRQAYNASKGAATRFQWGASYVRALIRLKPDEHDLILQTAEALFNEVKPDDVFTGRNYRVLRRLNEKLEAWKADSTRDALQKRFTAHINDLCNAAPDGTTAKQNCQTLVHGGTAS